MKRQQPETKKQKPPRTALHEEALGSGTDTGSRVLLERYRDVPIGLSKTFGRRIEKIKQQVGLSDMVEDEAYKAYGMSLRIRRRLGKKTPPGKVMKLLSTRRRESWKRKLSSGGKSRCSRCNSLYIDSVIS